MQVLRQYILKLKHSWKEGRVIRELVKRYSFDVHTARRLCAKDDIPFTIRYTSSTPEQLASDINHFFVDGILKLENRAETAS